MEQEQGMTIPGEGYLPGEDAARGTDGTAFKDHRTGPTWRGFVLAILVAIILSVTTTLLLGGSWSSYTLNPAAAVSSGGCGAGGNCCPPPDSGK
ncbi:MAG: hypothetical protein AABY80_03600 [Candidatus Deferrimicrobiota bacterium]